jgi:hypothetical protein
MLQGLRADFTRGQSYLPSTPASFFWHRTILVASSIAIPIIAVTSIRSLRMSYINLGGELIEEHRKERERDECLMGNR